MNSLVGFKKWDSVIRVKYTYRKVNMDDAVVVPVAVWKEMKVHGFNGVFEVNNIAQDTHQCRDDKGERIRLEDKLVEMNIRMPLKITLISRNSGKGAGSNYIECMLYGWTKDPEGKIVVHVDSPDQATERHTGKNVK